ncbi:MAG: gamma-glutamyl-gamma-aminobutyrate hydrolase family protein [Pseudomonadota bacterium]
MKRPWIGIAPYLRTKENGVETIGADRSYVDAVEKVGGLVLILTLDTKRISEYLRLLDGLLLTGGKDIHPKFYGERLPAGPADLSPDARTEFELAITKEFINGRKPILGICLGCQTLNVAAGGTLIFDLPSHQRTEHPITIAEKSLLAGIIGSRRPIVNSRHHQAVKKLGRKFILSAKADDGVIEGIELPSHPFALGVQWHPEDEMDKSSSKKLFRAFLQACGG